MPPTPKPQPRESVQDMIAKLIDQIRQSHENDWVLDNFGKRISDLEEIVRSMKAGQDDLAAIVAGLTDAVYGETDMTEGLILNVTQAAKTLGVSRTTLYKLIESGALPAKKFTSSDEAEPRTVILSEDLKTFLAGLPDAKVGSGEIVVDIPVDDTVRRQPRSL